MKRFILYYSTLLLILSSHLAVSQCPDTDVSVGSDLCRDAYVQIENNSTASNFVWDFCADELSSVPVPEVVVDNNREFARARGFDLFEDQGQKYLVSISNATYNITIVLFGDTYARTPVVLARNAVSSLTFSPFDVAAVVDGDIRAIFFVATNERILYRAEYGSSWVNTPTITAVASGFSAPPNAIDIIKDGSDFFGFVSLQNSIVKLEFGSNILNNSPVATEAQTSGPNVFRNMDFVEECGEIIGLVTSYQTRDIYRISFDNGRPNGNMQLTGLPNTGANYNFPAGLAMAKEGDSTFVFVQSATGQVIQSSFDGLPSGAFDGIDYGQLAGSNQSFPFALIKEGPTYYAFSADHRNRDLVRYTFPSACEADQELVTGPTPLKSYNSSGRKVISLLAETSTGISRSTFEVNVSNDEAPLVGFDATVACSSDPVLFQFTEDPDNLVLTWDFGDGTMGGGVNPSHTYTSTGTYLVMVEAESPNGCTNALTSTIEVREDIVASFSREGGASCTNQQVRFSNETMNAVEGSTVYRWSVNGSQVSTDQDLIYEFPTPGSYTIRLESQDQECISSFEETLTILEGAVAAFDAGNACDGETIQFTNTSAGDISGYSWDFGDGTSSTEVSPSHIFPSPGDYDVVLTTTSPNGCATTAHKQITIYAEPIADFTQELSCTDVPVRFTDMSQVVGANIVTWSWDFGAAGTSTAQNPEVEFDSPGDYNVSLSVTTDFGCFSSVTKTVTVLASPEAAFSFSNACEGEEVQFTDESVPALGTMINEYVWDIDGTFSNDRNPTFTFDGPGDYLVSLVVIASDQCANSITRTVSIPEQPIVDFTVGSQCNGLEFSFTDLTEVTGDNVVSRTWDFDGLGSATDSIALFTFPAEGSYQVSLEIETSGGCSYMLSRQVPVVMPPDAGFEPSTRVGAPPLTVNFNNTSSGDNVYTWLINDVEVSSQTNLVYTFEETGRFLVTLNAINQYGCESEFTDFIDVGVPEMDLAALSLTTDGSTLRLEVFNAGNVPVSVMPVEILTDESQSSINVDVDILPGEREFVRLPAVSGSGEYTCVEIGNVIEGIEDIDPTNNSTCETNGGGVIFTEPFPNPTSEFVNVHIYSGGEDEVEFTWIDASGRQIETPPLSLQSPGSGIIRFDVADMARGIYLLVVTSKSGQFIYRLAIQ